MHSLEKAIEIENQECELILLIIGVLTHMPNLLKILLQSVFNPCLSDLIFDSIQENTFKITETYM